MSKMANLLFNFQDSVYVHELFSEAFHCLNYFYPKIQWGFASQSPKLTPHSKNFQYELNFNSIFFPFNDVKRWQPHWFVYTIEKHFINLDCLCNLWMKTERIKKILFIIFIVDDM